jgi:hypothetical protein
VISNWEDSLFDLRRRRLTVVGAVSEIGINSQMIHDFLDDAAFVVNEPIAARRTVFTPNSPSRYTSTAMQASSTSSSPPVRTVPNAAPVARGISAGCWPSRSGGTPQVLWSPEQWCCGVLIASRANWGRFVSGILCATKAASIEESQR